jgi:hypothetical protein
MNIDNCKSYATEGVKKMTSQPKYHVSLVADGEQIVSIKATKIGSFASFSKAATAAKKAARTRRDCINYGPTSVAYVGNEATAVIVW